MQLTFTRAHSAMLTRYIGISFITGAISHGVFSETRALLTGLVGIALFTVGSYFETIQSKQIQWNIISSGTFLAVGIGAVTGGLQHFPDSPERSVWIIPIGLAFSLWFYAKSHEYKLGGKERQYMLIVMTVGILISFGLFGLIKYTGIGGHSHDMAIGGHDTSSTTPTISSTDHSPTTNTPQSHDMMHMSMSDMGTMLAGKSWEEIDKAFLAGMIPHHQGAVDMAAYLSWAKHPELRQLGLDIIVAQKREIALMQKWQKDWGYTVTATGAPGSAMMRDHCRSMPEMAGCEKFR